MKKDSILAAFFSAIEKDQRLGISHIGLYVTLIWLWEKQGCNGPVIAFGREVMELSRIGSTATYQKLIRQLVQYGYIQYKPSLYKGRGSRIFLRSSPNKGINAEELI